jgi:glycosyltransferase involved in cell wall biosynthesis
MLIINGSFVDKPLTGVQRYAYEICLALRAMGFPFRIVAPSNIQFPQYAVLNEAIELLPRSRLAKWIRWEQADLAGYMRKHRGDILWNPSNLALFGSCRQFTTVHDLAVYQNAAWFNWKFAALYKLYTPHTLRASERVLTVSETIKGEITSRFGIPPGKISITYDGWRPSEAPKTATPPEKYVMILGSLDPRKNLSNALLAWRGLSADLRSRVKLYVVGGANWRLAHRAEHADTGDDDSIRFLGRVSDAELEGLLDGCLANLYLSKYEGFGLPVLEALVRNKPCLVSDVPVFRELFDAGCAFVDPENVAEITRSLERLIERSLKGTPDGSFAEGYILKYDWTAAARIVADMYEELSRKPR